MAEQKDAKQKIYEAIAAAVKAKTEKNIGASGGQVLFNLVVSEIFKAAVKEQTFRFNGGYGSLHIKHYQAGTRQIPSGTSVTFGERNKLRYEQGVTVSDLIDGKPAEEAPAAEPTKAATTPAAPATAEMNLD